MILLQENPSDKIREDKEKIKRKRHQLHVMMSAYCTISCDSTTTSKEDVQQQKDEE